MRNEMETAVPEWVSAQLRARQSVIDASQRLAQYGRFGLQEILKIALDPTVAVDLRTDALTLFAASERGGEGALPMLLESGDKLLVAEMLKRIREFRTEWAATEIISRIRAASEPSERALLAWALAGYSGNGEALDVLMDLIKLDPDGIVRNHAIESLSEFRFPVVVDALLSTLEHGSASERFWSLYSLGTIRDTRAVEAISQCLHDQTQIPDFGTISAEAQWALREINGQAQGGRPRSD